MDTNGLYEALGIDTGAADTTAENGESAEPDNAESSAGGTEQELAEPAQEPSEAGAEGKEKQTKADNAKYARQRRERERQQAIDAARLEERDKLERILKNAGIVDPNSRGGRITTIEQLEKLEREKAAKNAAKALNETGELTDEELTALLRNTESGRKLLRSTASAQAEKAAVYRTQQLGQISKLDPSIKTFEDLQNIPEYEIFEGYVKTNGLAWSDAYRLACGDRLSQKSAARTRQQTLNDIGGKAHMMQDSSRGGEGTELPRDIEAMYKAMNPSLTHEQCVKKYGEYLKRTKKG